MTHRVPCPVIRLPLGQMAEHPLRLQLAQGTVLSHFNLSLGEARVVSLVVVVSDQAYLRHSAQESAPSRHHHQQGARNQASVHGPRARLVSLSCSFCAVTSFLFTWGIYVEEEREEGGEKGER